MVIETQPAKTAVKLRQERHVKEEDARGWQNTPDPVRVVTDGVWNKFFGPLAIRMALPMNPVGACRATSWSCSKAEGSASYARLKQPGQRALSETRFKQVLPGTPLLPVKA
jgi:hypothetical protein